MVKSVENGVDFFGRQGVFILVTIAMLSLAWFSGWRLIGPFCFLRYFFYDMNGRKLLIVTLLTEVSGALKVYFKRAALLLKAFLIDAWVDA